MAKKVVRENGKTVFSDKNLILVYSEVDRLAKRLDSFDTDKCFNIKFRGYEFNCLPFLLNGTAYFSPIYRSSLVDNIARRELTTTIVDETDLKSIKNFDFDVLYSLYPACSDYGTRLMGALLYGHYPKDLLQLLFRGSLEILEDVIYNGEMIHIDYKYKEICNTQAFCYYLSIFWFISLSPVLASMVARDISKSGLKKIMYELCPEDSIHFKYIKGEITGKELLKQYKDKSYSDGSSICIRESICDASEGAYDGRKLSGVEVGLGKDVYEFNTLNEAYKLNMHLAYSYLFDGTYERLNKEVASANQEIEYEKDQVVKLNNKLSASQRELNSIRDEYRKLEEENNKLKGLIAETKDYPELQSEISSLKGIIKNLEFENNRLFDERLSLKQTISSQKKEIKKLSASPEELIEEEAILEEIAEATFEDMVARIKDLKFAFIGYDCSAIMQKFKEYGVDDIKQFTTGKKALGKCDYVIVLSIRCSHATVYKAESLCKNTDTQIIYYNGVNAEQLIRILYESLNEVLC